MFRKDAAKLAALEEGLDEAKSRIAHLNQQRAAAADAHRAELQRQAAAEAGVAELERKAMASRVRVTELVAKAVDLERQIALADESAESARAASAGRLAVVRAEAAGVQEHVKQQQMLLLQQQADVRMRDALLVKQRADALAQDAQLAQLRAEELRMILKLRSIAALLEGGSAEKAAEQMAAVAAALAAEQAATDAQVEAAAAAAAVPTFNCSICTFSRPIHEHVYFGCGHEDHTSCKSCLANHIREKMSIRGKSVKCMSCKAVLSTHVIDQAGMLQEYIRATLTTDVRGWHCPDLFRCCNAPACKGLLSRKTVVSASVEGTTRLWATCGACRQVQCATCHRDVHAHVGTTCTQLMHAAVRAKCEALAATYPGGDAKPCPRCLDVFLKEAGTCNSCSCTSCDTRFCWLCGTILTDDSVPVGLRHTAAHAHYDIVIRPGLGDHVKALVRRLQRNECLDNMWEPAPPYHLSYETVSEALFGVRLSPPAE